MADKKDICVFCGHKEIDLLKEKDGDKFYFCPECKAMFTIEKRVD